MSPRSGESSLSSSLEKTFFNVFWALPESSSSELTGGAEMSISFPGARILFFVFLGGFTAGLAAVSLELMVWRSLAGLSYLLKPTDLMLRLELIPARPPADTQASSRN